MTYIGVDIGGSKTLVASFSTPNTIEDSVKFATPHEPVTLVKRIFSTIETLLDGDRPTAIGIAVPGHIDDGLVTNTTTLKWDRVPLQQLCRERTDAPFRLENDAVLGGLSEARIGHGQDCTNLLYITISTGVGTSIIIDGSIPDFIRGSEGGHMIIGETDGQPTTFESLVSGTAFQHRFGAPGFEVDDPNVWETYGRDLARGIFDLAAVIEPDRVVIGGGMAVHFQRFSQSLQTHMGRLDQGIFPLPEVVCAKHPELAVLYGCAIIAEEVSHT